MNLEHHTLDELEVEKFHLKEVLRSVLHTILFHRALGPVKPVECESELLDIEYVRCGDADVDKSIEEAIETFSNSLAEVGPDLARGKLELSFFEKRRRYLFGVARSSEKVYWEQWSVPVVVNTRPRAVGENAITALESDRSQAATEQAVAECMMQVVTLANKRTQHIPPVNYHAKSPMTFSYELSVGKAADTGWNWLSRMMGGGVEPPKLGL